MAKTETLTDQFTTQSAKWSGYTASTVVSSGVLTITPTGSYPNIYSSLSYDLTSSYVMVQLVQPPNVGNGSISAAMNVEVSTNNEESIGWSNGELFFSEKIGGVVSETTIAYNATNHKWLRMRESAGTIYWETSADCISWTTQRSKTAGLTLTSVRVVLYSGYWDTEPSPGTAIFDNLNTPVYATAYTGWTVGRIPMGAMDGGTVLTRNYFDTADWLWSPIPANPVLDTNSGAMVASLSSTAGGAMRIANMYDYGVTIVNPSSVDTNTPRYDIAFANEPAWGSDPFGADTMPIPNGTIVPPGSDGHVTVADPINGKVYSLWQGVHSTGWSASWGGVTSLHGDGRETSGTSTATGLSRYAGVIRGSEIAAGQIPHALFFATDMAHTTEFRYPAIKTDGTNAAGVAFPIPEGTRVQLDPAIDVTAISGITAGEIAVAKALQIYGAYCGDRGSARMAFIFEYLNDGTNPGQVYVNAGLGWDYFDMSHIPWSSLRVLQNWDGS